MKIALAQVNPTVGDVDGNAELLLSWSRRAAEAGADLVVFPELALSGYPPRDLIELRSFRHRNEAALERLAAATSELGLGIIAGYAASCERGRPPQTAWNAAAYMADGKIVAERHKALLPQYDVFDDSRLFSPGASAPPLAIGGQSVGVTICEDMWNDSVFWDEPLYGHDPVEDVVRDGANIVINLSASPYRSGKRSLRLKILQHAARRHGTAMVFVNQVGGNDHVIFDGSSLVVDPSGAVVAQASSFEEDLVVYDTATGRGDLHEQPSDERTAIFDALVLGTRDYIRKCGFQRVLIGLSGGMDSSLTAAIAVAALGRENVSGVAMPGPYSSEGSLTDAEAMAQRLGIEMDVVRIGDSYDAMLSALGSALGDDTFGLTQENLQARLRGSVLMALSNKRGAMVLTTGNKSEIAVGYSTLYGDMCGGLAVIGDVPKTLAYELARVANERLDGAIPQSVFAKPPSAELAPDQKDTDSLPPYEVLDPMLEAYIEQGKSTAEIVESTGQPVDVVARIARMVDRNEYKRQQAATILRVTSKAFGYGRRFPIAQRFVR